MELSQLTLKLLNMRGITSQEAIEEFLSPSPKLTYDPFLLPDMEEGADLILREIANGTRIMIYGDYDADGMTATALLLTVLGHLMKGREQDLDYYIPSRFDEGYGLNMEAIKSIHDRGFGLIVTVDCGAVSEQEAKYAEELGMRILVTDHHNITDRMAKCLLIDPKKPGSRYPFEGLCGCGVAFKLSQALKAKSDLPTTVLAEVLDLVAIGTIGDMMPLTDENRTLVKYGLRTLNSGKRPGLAELIRVSGLELGNITSEEAGFILVPHLNAAGRLGDASLGVRLLTAKEGDLGIKDMAAQLNSMNDRRKSFQQETYVKCVALMDEGDFKLIQCPDAHEGIAGIVAGKIKETYNRPCIICMKTQEEGYLKGTGRSIDGISLYDMLKKYEKLFVKFGGHSKACGFTISEKDIPELKEGLLRDIEEIRRRDPELFERKYPWDLEAGVGDCSMELADELKLLEPFGQDNKRPAFLVKDGIVTDVRFMGDEGQHVRFTLKGDRGEYLGCVLFRRAGEFADILKPGRHVSVTGALEIQVWQGRKRLQLMAENIID
ncbi:MAG: single-stranded-DNA-specific exonuclease RecJ [Firmicutes bacterium]|nr:single-stranded-DNA-specific exonuclease RecJ [Bacillota bacterium]